MKFRRYAAGFLAAMIFLFSSVFPVFAEPHTLGDLDAYLVPTASNAMSIVPYSTLGTVKNTIDLTGVRFFVYYDNDSIGVKNIMKYGSASWDNYRLSFSIFLSENEVIKSYGFQLFPQNLPVSGTYNFGFDLSSDFSYELSAMDIYSRKQPSNAGYQDSSFSLRFSQLSGDVYSPSNIFNLTNVQYLTVNGYVKDSSLHNMAGSCAFQFLVSSSDPDAPSTAGTNTSQQDWENNISSSLGDISSSLSGVDESLEYISQSQNLIIQGIDNVILHISDQLYAFWDQLYNLIHVPTYAILQQILQAIHDLDISVDVNLDELTDTLDRNHEEQIASDTQIADEIQNGYDNSGLTSSNQQLGAALEDQAQKEDQILEQISDPLESFTFSNPISQYLDSFLLLGDFLQDLYTGSGAFKDVINLSFLMGIALMVVGLYRFKGGN